MICPLCSSLSPTTIHTSNGYILLRCLECGLGFLQNPPTDISSIYGEHYFDDKRSTDYVEDAKKKFEFAKSYIDPHSKILDFGCGTGDFVGICRKGGYDIQGFDISKFAASHTSNTYGVIVKSGVLSMDMFEPQSFDVITCFDVIEHIPDFLFAMNVLSKWLKRGGRLIVTTPNIDSWDARVLGRFWYGFTKLPQHLLYFSPRSIERTLTQSGFTSISTRQWGFVRSLGFWMKKSFPPYIYFPMVDSITIATT